MTKIPDSQSIAEWYNARYINGQEQTFGRPPEESIQRLQYLPSLQNLLVLDVACGQGYFLKAVQEGGGQGVGVDISVEAVRIAQVFAPKAQTGVANGEHLPFANNTFDVLTCWGSLEHHRDMKQALSEFVRVTKPGSKMVFRVPNRNFWVYVILSLLRYRVGTEQQDVVEHLLSLEEWSALFKQAGLTIESVNPDNWFLQHKLTTVPSAIGKLKMLARKLVLWPAPLKYTYAFDIVCQS